MRKAWRACQNSGVDPNDHFVVIHEMVKIGSNAERQVDSVRLSRYACYLTVQNADPSKKEPSPFLCVPLMTTNHPSPIAKMNNFRFPLSVVRFPKR